MDITERVVDKNRVGDTLILVRSVSPVVSKKEGENTHGLSGLKISHYSVFVDIQGSSNEEIISGCEIRLFLDCESLQDAFCRCKGIRQSREDYDAIFFIRKDVIDFNCCAPMLTARNDLSDIVLPPFKSLVNKNSEIRWTSELNCQQYTRVVVL